MTSTIFNISCLLLCVDAVLDTLLQFFLSQEAFIIIGNIEKIVFPSFRADIILTCKLLKTWLKGNGEELYILFTQPLR